MAYVAKVSISSSAHMGNAIEYIEKEEKALKLEEFKKALADKHAKFFIIDAVNLARQIGLGGRTNTILQNMFPSEQRATLISIDSFIFSVIMIVLSPLAGMFFAMW